jgi:hypothetical protein
MSAFEKCANQFADANIVIDDLEQMRSIQ